MSLEYTATPDRATFDLYVRGSVPPELAGALIVPTSRRSKDRAAYSRWHDSQTDLMRLDVTPGKPGRIRVHVLGVDSTAADLPARYRSGEHAVRAYGARTHRGYATQPNHGVNVAGQTLWATNLLFGAPVEVDVSRWEVRRVLAYLEPNELAPRLSATSHFAWSLDRRTAYFHESLLQCETPGDTVRAAELSIIEVDAASGAERIWRLRPPPEDADLAAANFHSTFYFEEGGRPHLGLLRTGALLEHLAPHSEPVDHAVCPMPASTIWVVALDPSREVLQAQLLPGIRELDALAISHLDIDASSRDGFVLFANFKHADVAEDTHGPNIYDERPEVIAEHYPGMTVEPLNIGLVIRYERRAGQTSVRRFQRAYDPDQASRGHSWLPINIDLEPAGRHLFCTFAGFRPRLLSRHIAAAYPERVIDPGQIRYVPPLLMRFDARTLEPDIDKGRGHLSYTEPIAMTVIGDARASYVCTFSPEFGLRIYEAGDLSHMICHAVSPQLMHWRDGHFRPEPAHIGFVPS